MRKEDIIREYNFINLLSISFNNKKIILEQGLIKPTSYMQLMDLKIHAILTEKRVSSDFPKGSPPLKMLKISGLEELGQ